MSTDIRFDPRADGLPNRLRQQFAIDVPVEVAAKIDWRVDAAISNALTRPRPAHGRDIGGVLRSRRGIAVVLGIAVILAAAAPVVEFFDGWGEDFDRVFALSTPIDQSVIDDGYRVTLVRAYADPSSLRLAIVAEDLEDRGWREIGADFPSVTDDAGHVFPNTSGQYLQPSTTSSEAWLRFDVPSGAGDPGLRHLTVTINGLGVRFDPVPTLSNGEVDVDHLGTAVAGHWSFDFDLMFQAEHSAKPDVKASAAGVTVTFAELTVTPAATVGRLSVTGLRQVEWGWDPYMKVEHDGKTIDLKMLDPGSVQASEPGATQDRLVFEGAPGFEDLSGTWTITIDRFHRNIPDPNSDITTQEESVVGPWVLTFEGPPAAP
jgi:hypothetical protein